MKPGSLKLGEHTRSVMMGCLSYKTLNISELSIIIEYLRSWSKYLNLKKIKSNIDILWSTILNLEK